MRYIIIPCLNEGENLDNIIEICNRSVADMILVVNNGSIDNSYNILKCNPYYRLCHINVNLALGHDIPKALGLYYSLLEDGDSFVFLDGDMLGVKEDDINVIFSKLQSGTDLALTNCYSDNIIPSGLAAYVLEFRRMLNLELGIYPKIGYSTPSHGLFGISKALAEYIPLESLGIPPLLLNYSVEGNYNVAVALNKPHLSLGSKERSEKHRLKMSETIIGDTIFAYKKARKIIPNRMYDGLSYIGFHENRRFDLLNLLTHPN